MSTDSKTEAIDLDALEKLLAEATPGEWVAGHVSGRCTLEHGRGPGGHGSSDCVYMQLGPSGDHEISAGRIGPQFRYDDASIVAGMWDYEDGGIRRKEDRDLFISLRNAAPALIALARKALAAPPEKPAAREEPRCEQVQPLLVDANNIPLPIGPYAPSPAQPTEEVRRQEELRIALRELREVQESGDVDEDTGTALNVVEHRLLALLPPGETWPIPASAPKDDGEVRRLREALEASTNLITSFASGAPVSRALVARVQGANRAALKGES